MVIWSVDEDRGIISGLHIHYEDAAAEEEWIEEREDINSCLPSVPACLPARVDVAEEVLMR